MIEPGHGFVHGLDRLNVRQHGPAQYDHRQAKSASCRDLAVGRGAAAVLGDDHVNAMLFQHPALIGYVERTAAGEIDGMWNRKRWHDRVNAAYQIAVLWGVRKGPDFLAADSKKDAARCVAERPHGVRHVADLDPTVPSNRDPAGPTQGKQQNSCLAGGGGRVNRNRGRVRVGRIDENIDFMVDEMICQAFNTTKTAYPHRNRLHRGSSCATRERKHHGQVSPRDQPFGELARFRGAAENEDSHVAC